MFCTRHVNIVGVVVEAILGVVDGSPDSICDSLLEILIEDLSFSFIMSMLLGSLLGLTFLCRLGFYWVLYYVFPEACHLNCGWIYGHNSC